MATDFAKNTKKRKSASRLDSQKSKKSIPGWVWMIAGLIIGIIASTLIYLKTQQPDNSPVKKPETTKPSAKTRYQAVPADEATSSDFNFHDLLENKTVDVPVDEVKPDQGTSYEKSYIMQCGSFREKSRAESLKAQIALNGFEASIKATVEASGTRWFRVTLGPYKSKRLAERQRHQLERNEINNCRIW